ncbi:Peptidyl-prolyl cis-trans isomerase-like 4 [Neolecta irregularis DAH-3]|uniref:peptidylprolyl isomerase n=1 Tax=Neolecta irregularis (strain DAH-3) TaxID=1198029 RepID=A0A1U7LQB2_NEOID|nr:Peptidyl-prolyl cis-trans isomerase-like 4 [Neolecta irregularis DAH-3]|eukprot:OLL24773.1 Peptidyl-prolyl cis-trans isomerase-like 4 [Neolecta irregularis DAH-3]
MSTTPSPLDSPTRQVSDNEQDQATDDDFGDFEQEDEFESSSQLLLPQKIDTLNPSKVQDYDSLVCEISLLLANCFEYKDQLHRQTTHVPLPLFPETPILVSERSAVLWNQLITPPPTSIPDWKRSRIKRQFLVSLGVPVDLDEILPQKKQKKLVLPSSNEEPRGPITRHGKEIPGPPEFDMDSARRIASVSHAALSNMTTQEFQDHVEKVKSNVVGAKKLLEYWAERENVAEGDKEAFESVIESLVDYAQRMRKGTIHRASMPRGSVSKVKFVSRKKNIITTTIKRTSFQFLALLASLSLMSAVLLETSVGDIVVDLLAQYAPQTCTNFIKLCKVKYYNFSPIYNLQKDFSFQTGDPIGPTGDGGSSIYGLLGTGERYIPAEIHPKLKHSEKGTVSMAVIWPHNDERGMIASQFFITTGENLDYLDGKHAIFGRVAEGFDVLEKINMAFVDEKGMPFTDIRIKHTIILEDPYSDPEGLVAPSTSPVPTKAQLMTVRIAEGELEQDQGLSEEELERRRREREAKAQALTLEMVGDLPFAEVAPPENILFGKILSCEVIRDQRTGDSLQYAFIEFEKKEECEAAYFKMQDVLIDDKRIHVDFSQSVSKLSSQWRDSTNQKRRAAAQRGFGGSEGLQRWRRYRDDDGRRGEGEYRMVFDHEERRRRSRSRELRQDSERREERARDERRMRDEREQNRYYGDRKRYRE